MGQGTWARLFLPVNNGVLPVLSTVSTWASGQSYKSADAATFLNVADYYLVAYALAHNYTIVTHEVKQKKQGKLQGKIKIPDACIGLELNCISPYDMLKNERAKFILGQQQV